MMAARYGHGGVVGALLENMGEAVRLVVKVVMAVEEK